MLYTQGMASWVIEIGDVAAIHSTVEFTGSKLAAVRRYRKLGRQNLNLLVWLYMVTPQGKASQPTLRA